MADEEGATATTSLVEDADHVQQSDSINPLSSHFDATAALSAPSIPGLEVVEPLRSLQEFEDYQSNPTLFLQAQAERKDKEALKKAAKQKSAQESAALQSRSAKPKIIKNVLIRMQKIEGPTGLLQRWIQSRTRVKVVTRSYKSIRGTCSGFMVAFDRYMNLAMVDVDETYWSLRRSGDATRGLKNARTDASEADTDVGHKTVDAEIELLTRRVESSRITKASNIKHRHLKQVFLRGDNIVSINSCL